jgi:hypothetical protein
LKDARRKRENQFASNTLVMQTTDLVNVTLLVVVVQAERMLSVMTTTDAQSTLATQAPENATTRTLIAGVNVPTVNALLEQQL